MCITLICAELFVLVTSVNVRNLLTPYYGEEAALPPEAYSAAALLRAHQIRSVELDKKLVDDAAYLSSLSIAGNHQDDISDSERSILDAELKIYQRTVEGGYPARVESGAPYRVSFGNIPADSRCTLVESKVPAYLYHCVGVQ